MRVHNDTSLWHDPNEGNTTSLSTQHQYDAYDHHQYVSPEYDGYHQYVSPNYSGTSPYLPDPNHATSHPFIPSQDYYPSLPPPQEYYDAPQPEVKPMGRDYTNAPDHSYHTDHNYRRRLVAVERYYEIETRPPVRTRRTTTTTTEKSPRPMSPNEVHNRLYSLSSAKQEAGRQKRQEIARKCNRKSFVPINNRISSVDAIELTDRLYNERRNKYREIYEEVSEPGLIRCGNEEREGNEQEGGREVIQFCLEEPDELDNDGIFEY